MGKSNKKEEALTSKEFKEYLIMLENLGITAEDIDEIYRIMERTGIIITRSTFVRSLAEQLQYFIYNRNRGIGEKSPHYIGRKAYINMIRENPKIVEKGIESIDKTCATIDSFSWTDSQKANQILITSPIVYSNSPERLAIQNSILSNFGILGSTNKKIRLSEYVFLHSPNDLRTSPQKLFSRLAYFAESNESTIMSTQQYRSLMKNAKSFTGFYGISDEKLQKKYVLPEYDEARPQHFADCIYKKIHEFKSR